MKPTYEPYPDEETTVYRFTGSFLRLPSADSGERQVVENGDTVALPDRAAESIDDLLAPVDDDRDDAEPDVEPDDGEEPTESESETETETDDEPDAASTDDAETAGQGGGGDGSSGDEPGGEDGKTGLPDPLPDDYRELQSLAQEFGIDARQSKADLQEQLAEQRGS